MPSHIARIEPSGARWAFVTRLQVGKLYLIILDATAVASPLGAAPMLVPPLPDCAWQILKTKHMANARVTDFVVLTISVP